jgi:hypothetical protein
MINVKSPSEAYEYVKQLSSALTDDEHLVRSCIFDLHAAVEIELKRVFSHTFSPLLFRADDDDQNRESEEALDKMISKLSFAQVYRVLKPILDSWPYPDLMSIQALNDARNQVAHETDIGKVDYKGRNPFSDADCFAQMFIDVFAIREAIAEFFDHGVDYQKTVLERYVAEYGSELLH